MRIFITGGKGAIGSFLTKELVTHGHNVTILTRNIKTQPQKLPSAVSFIEGNPTRPGHWQDHIKCHDAVINLAGESIFQRWNDENKKNILDSRVNATRNIVEAISRAGNKNIALFNASAIGYYGFHQDEEIDESFPAGSGFLAEVVQKWEAAAKEAEKHINRVVLCRFGIVLDGKAGALKKMLPAFKFGLGTHIGSGDQWFSWVSIDDLAQIFLFLLEHPEISGSVNCTAPQPVTNYMFAKTLGKVLRRPVFLPSPPPGLIKFLLGEFSTVLLEGQKVLPKRLIDKGFRFKHTTLFLALIDLI